MTIKQKAEKDFMEAAFNYFQQSPAIGCCKEDMLLGKNLNPVLTDFIQTGTLLQKVRKEEGAKKIENHVYVVHLN